MTTNTKEYMRDYQRARRARIKNDVKKNVKIVKKSVKISELHPPMASKLVASEKGLSRHAENHVESGEQASPTDSKLAIDFSYLANNSSFQRGIIEFIKKYVPGLENVDARGSKEVMKQSFDQNAHNYRDVMKELKQVLEMRKK